MARGPFFGVKRVYSLDFGAFTVGAHLKLLSEQESATQGLDAELQNLEALCTDPKEGDPRIRHEMTASITPDFMGLQGTFTVKARPESRLIPVVSAIGLKLYGEFSEAATSATSSWLPWVRTRRVRTGLQPDTKAPIFSTEQETVMLEQLTERGDLTGDFTGTGANVLAVAETLKTGDILTREGESFVVINVLPQGQYERAELSLRSY